MSIEDRQWHSRVNGGQMVTPDFDRFWYGLDSGSRYLLGLVHKSLLLEATFNVKQVIV